MRLLPRARLPVIALLAIIAPTGLRAQTVIDSSAFRRLELPAANAYRTGAGRPGPAYWQQRADYRIDATLDVAKNELHGRETIRYTNNSPAALTYLWMYVEQNICAPSSVTNTLNQPPLRFGESVFDFSCQGFNGGETLESVRAGGRDVARTLFGTTMRLDLPTPLAPGASTDIDIAWRFPVPDYGAGRMGHDGPLYEIAQWYPRMAVYDDVKGWNTEPFIGAGEFYLEYGSFDVSLTVPASYIIAATGRLLNPEDVLTGAQRTRLARALTADSAIAVIAATEAGKPTTRPKSDGTLTWRFHADSVRDFAFAGGPTLRWDASGYDGILINTLYRPTATNWPEANRMARHAIRWFSEQWFRYPYAHATTIEGPIEGMEYPMLTFVPNGVSREDLQWVLSHEFGHEWFPMVVGSNERLYPWMDEGFNTFIDIGVAESYFTGTTYGDTVGRIPLAMVGEHTRPGDEQPLITKPVEVRDLFWTAYRKPALMLNTLRHEILGDARFDYAFREYIRAWAFRHPTPADFFRVMGDASGMDLDWFWRGWALTTARLDQAVDSVATADGAALVYLSNRGEMVMPVELRVSWSDGRTETVKLPVEMWNLGNRFTWRVASGGGRTITVVEVDPRAVMPDIDRSNNVWRR